MQRIPKPEAMEISRERERRETEGESYKVYLGLTKWIHQVHKTSIYITIKIRLSNFNVFDLVRVFFLFVSDSNADVRIIST